MSISEKTAAIVSGTALVIHGALKRGPLGAIAIGVGGVITWFALRPGTAPVLSGRQVFRGSHTIDSDPYDAFLKWQDLSQLPSALRQIGSVKRLNTGNWRVGLPGGMGNLEMRIANEQPGRVIEWRSVDGSKIDGYGIVRFTRKKNGRGTKVHMEFSYGKAGESGKSGSPQPELQTA